MDKKKLIKKEINDITSLLIKYGLSVEQNFPSVKGGKIYISNMDNLSIALKNVTYAEIYEILEKDKNFNIKMIDGALIQLMYEFSSSDELIKHRLSFFPSPNLIEYQNEKEIYELDEIYADILSYNIVTTPIRFDFDTNSDNVRDVEHPVSHLTIGQYKNCRIPIHSALTPKTFITFILMNFYNTAYKKFQISLSSELSFDITITENEKKILHLNQL